MKECPSFKGYSVDEEANVYSHRTRKPIVGQHGGSYAIIDYNRCKKISPTRNKKGYLQVCIVTATGIRPIGIHVLMADAYIRPKVGDEVVRHLDDNKNNNCVSNLAYGSHVDNAMDRMKNGNYLSGHNHSNAKLSEKDVVLIRELRNSKTKVKDIASRLNVSVSTIESVLYGKSYKTSNRTIDTTGRPE